jgi:hypothetical protein
MNNGGIGIADAITSLRGELLQAVERASSESLRFTVETINVELQVVADAAGSATAGIGLWRVVTLGARIDYSRATTHRVAVTLKPAIGPDQAVEVRDTLTERPG